MDLIGLKESQITFFLIILIISFISLIVTRKLLKVSFPYFFMGILGITAGLILGNIVGKTLIRLPGNYGVWLPMIIQIFIAVAILDLFLAQAKPVTKFFAKFADSDVDKAMGAEDIVIDTSVFIDGRIEEIVNSGFVYGTMIVPKFVLAELQSIADSANDLKRAKGRNGLEMLGNLQKNRQVMIEIIEDRLKDKDKVDSKLVKLSKDRKARLMSADYNLLQVAQIQGVDTLNINALAAAMKPMVMPGENMKVRVVQKGKEKKQGVGYLEDGTMVIVDGGDKFIGQELDCEVVRIHQTITGRMIFVQPKTN